MRRLPLAIHADRLCSDTHNTLQLPLSRDFVCASDDSHRFRASVLGLFSRGTAYLWPGEVVLHRREQRVVIYIVLAVPVTIGGLSARSVAVIRMLMWPQR